MSNVQRCDRRGGRFFYVGPDCTGTVRASNLLLPGEIELLVHGGWDLSCTTVLLVRALNVLLLANIELLVRDAGVYWVCLHACICPQRSRFGQNALYQGAVLRGVSYISCYEIVL